MIVKQLDEDAEVRTWVVFVELTEGWGGDEQSPGRRHSYTAELYRRSNTLALVRSCGHDHKYQERAEVCGRRLLREATKETTNG